MNFNEALPAPLPLGAVVPEPAAIGIVGFVSFCTQRRRHRRR